MKLAAPTRDPQSAALRTQQVRAHRRDGSRFGADVAVEPDPTSGPRFPRDWVAGQPSLFDSSDHRCFHSDLNGALLEVAAAAANLSGSLEVSYHIVGALRVLTGARRGFTARWDRSGESLRVMSVRGCRGEEAPFFAETAGLWGWVVEAGTTLLTNDAPSDPRRGEQPDTPPLVQSFLAVPVLAGEVVLGVIAVANAPGGFDDRDRMAVEHFALTLTGSIRAERVRDENRRLRGEIDGLRCRGARTQRLEALGFLSNGIAHEFNNLLTVISGYGEIVQSGLERDSELQAELTEILKAATSAGELSRRLLAFGRLHTPESRAIALDDLLAETVGMLRRLIGEDIRLEMRLLAGRSTVLLDPVQIEMVIMSLAVRARQMMPDGGVLSIGTEDVAGPLSVSGGPTRGGRVALLISDTGSTEAAGADPNEPTASLFDCEPPRAGDSCRATVGRLVTECGGSLSVASEPGHGTTYRILLPLADEAPESEASVTLDGGAPVGSESVFLVEDEAGVREFVFEVLEGAGYRVRAAGSGHEAIRKMAEGGGDRIDLLITDVVLPDIDGVELRGILTNGRPGMKALYISGYAKGAIRNWERMGAEDPLLPKPFTLQALLRRVREILDDRDGGHPCT